MDGLLTFDVNQSLKYYLSDPASVLTPDAAPELLDCETDSDLLTLPLVDQVLDPIVDAVAELPDGLLRNGFFDSLQCLLKSCSVLSTQSLSKILDLIVSGLAVEADAAHNDLESDETDLIPHHKQLLEMYAFLLQWAVSSVEAKIAEKPASTASARRGAGKSSKSKPGAKETTWDSGAQLQIAMETMCKVLKLKLSKIFMTTSDRDTFVNLFTRSIYLVLESEQRVKSMNIRMHAFKVLCIAVKHHGHGFGAQTSIVQSLTYFEHLSEPMAEFLHILADQYDYPQLSDEILRELGNKEFNPNDTKGPKSVSIFITKLSELAPRLIIKQMTLIAKQLDSEAYTLRCAVIEVCGNLIADLSKQDERSESAKSQINSFFDVLEERFLDVNPFCRSRAIQVYMRLCDLDQKFPKRRQAAAELALRSLEDRSSHVRRNAIKLLAKLVSSHPFSVMHGGQLSFKEWEARLEAVDFELTTLKPPPETPMLAEVGLDSGHLDSQLLDDATQLADESPSKIPQVTGEQKVESIKKAQEEAATSEIIARLQLTRKYYLEAIRFIEVLHSASQVVVQLLSSRNKSEVIEAMDFFVILDAYKIETARPGIRRMLRLIWTKGNSDEGKGVQSHLIDCYKGLFFDAPGSFSPNDASNYIARNMISLTFGATPAELTSLEQLLSMMMKVGHVPEPVISKLWQVYCVQKREISRTQRRGSIIVLGMLALSDPEIVVKEMEAMLRIGLGTFGRTDLVLAKYTCIALQRMNPGRQAKAKDITFPKLSNDHGVLLNLAAITEIVSESKEWFGVAEQAINAIYALAKHPDSLCSDVIRRKTKSVFQPHKDIHHSPSGFSSNIRPHTPENEETTLSHKSKPVGLSQLLFIVGHIAIKQIVHLELCELEFKRRKAENEKKKVTNPLSQDQPETTDNDELDLIGGTTEDDFTEAMAHIRERELLFGGKSLLSNFGPLVTEICANNNSYSDRNLQAAATICMAKLMCISSEYCEKNLPLLITIMERSDDPIVRSNAVIALGDMAVCFNHLIDENTDFLYRRLNDIDASVKRTCLMTLTFLILAGQVKVKGQLGEMAKCLEDEDKKIADLARMFFTELATKDNAVYNHFVDIFSLLSAETNLDGDSLKRILKFLAGFVEKDKHAKQLADKLAARLPRCETEKQWNDVVYALSLLSHKNDDITKTVNAGFKFVQATA
ncbi:condensin complex non-SMC subunit Cnd1 [Ophidiomyces ophidiicola]|uniref:condensin complex non-SMC subunit Cnd1 n=1 Tax=Ophidiomyces ophidiicola TaxID=1387563 RepID=UPI0020C51812|nr:condensin complex non-SMC subunit Cnd1 [Ophidiomyces ophidiicola]KAI1943391.1 condensin complex non-SMC subunit Cnd1 [Ophidiomyces ophidiicola]KAI1953035.1 condensin complex non-SMC subunit Cnd1 [Ophidiomyces ophidiicola]KAI1973553.1 condensin complex non-SMC subunit Cnd1 [Ophidiomyces ophidiicola]KAI1975012.1 condensin complex non-SMC subunit Cnd1 [Ophidiomyces ophidiicola]KAI1993169.1 condensin complex non-SMC subunit Cnd1 [Ophidiomyces ophidiicola]